MNVVRQAAVAALILLAVSCADDGDAQTDEVWQAGTISGLSVGGYDGPHAVSEVADHGDLGLGTYDGLDGEMVIVDDVIYQVRADGSVVEADEELSTPFAQVTTFDADERVDVDEPLTCEDLPATIESVVDDDSALVALRIEGQLSMLQTRSVPRQEAPYAPLADVVAEQQVTFDLAASRPSSSDSAPRPRWSRCHRRACTSTPSPATVVRAAMCSPASCSTRRSNSMWRAA